MRSRFISYFNHVSAIMTGRAGIASTFRNPSDIGAAREASYHDFLQRTLPSKLNVSFGGYVFNDAYEESPQVDIIVATEDAFRFGLLTPSSDTAIVRAQDTLALVESKSIMRRPILKHNGSDQDTTLNVGSDVVSAFQNIRSGKIAAGSSRPVGVIFGLDWEGMDSLEKAAPSISSYICHVLKTSDFSADEEFNLLPDIIHVHNKFLFFKPMYGDQLGGAPWQVADSEISYLIGFTPPYVDVGFAMVCERIMKKYRENHDAIYNRLMSAVFEAEMEKAGRARTKMHWISCVPRWERRDDVPGTEFHRPVELEARMVCKEIF